MKPLKLPQKPLIRIGLVLSLFLLLIGSGRLTQKAWDSLYFGERAPYLQMPAPRAITVRWQTEGYAQGRVHFGLEPGKLDRTVSEKRAGLAHSVRLQGLTPDTRYYYAVDGEPGSPERWFMTPPADASLPLRAWVIGDPGYPGEGQRKVRDAALAWMSKNARPGRASMDVWLTTGDNAYTSGRNEEFQRGLFAPYEEILRNFALWPVYGNHDARRWAYSELFDFPANGESGGLPSGTTSWYAFDHGPVHFVVLDSQASSRRADGAMVRWLRDDLAKNRLPWVVTLFHHPPYTKGSHNSDNPRDSGGRMQEMRANLLPALEAGGVDLVLSGHSHVYERSFLLACHYGASGTFADTMVVARGDGRPAVFTKAGGDHGGTVYAVVGSSARVDSGPLNHPAMAASLAEMGSLIFDVDGARLEARFIDSAGAIRDQFAIVKREGAAPARSCAGL